MSSLQMNNWKSKLTTFYWIEFVIWISINFFFIFFFVYFFVVFSILSVWIIFLFQLNQSDCRFFKFLFNIIWRIFLFKSFKKNFVMSSFKTVSSQTLNAILIKSNYQEIRQKIDFFFRRVAYFQLLQRCENVAIREKAFFVLFIDFMMKNVSIWTNINLMHFFRDRFSQMHTIYQINKIKIAKRKTKFLIKIETNWNEEKKTQKCFLQLIDANNEN